MTRALASIASGPALCGLLCVVLAGCASTPAPQPRPEPLVDRTAETDFDLTDVAQRLDQALAWSEKGNRTLASTICDAAHDALSQGRARDRRFLRVVQSIILGRIGPGRDDRAARSHLEQLPHDVDRRERAEIALAMAHIEIGAGNLFAAERWARNARQLLKQLGAYTRGVEAAVALAADLELAGDESRARAVAEQGLAWAQGLDDDLLLCDAVIELARYLPFAGREATLEQGYEAAFRANDLWALNAVCAEALRLWHEAGDHKSAVRWADRTRDRSMGDLPDTDQLGLGAADSFLFYARYALSRMSAGLKDDRAKIAFETALAAAVEGYPEWVDKLQRGLLQLGKD